jgi:hypothetical protein
MQFGVEAISEQELDTAKMGSHTARFGSILAMYYETTGDDSARARAFRSFNWATYCSSEDGIVNVGPNPREGFWFSDGYGDYIRHFMAGLGAIPEWVAPDANRLVRSTSVVQSVEATATTLSYTTFDAAGSDVLRLTSPVEQIEIDGVPATQGDAEDQYVEAAVETGGGVVKLRRASGATVSVQVQP